MNPRSGRIGSDTAYPHSPSDIPEVTSHPRHPPLRMTDRLFEELAVGGGSSEALAFLERGERTRRLLLLRTALAHTDAIPSPLGPPADAWHVIKAAAEQGEAA